jgi:hypothetical protein
MRFLSPAISTPSGNETETEAKGITQVMRIPWPAIANGIANGISGNKTKTEVEIEEASSETSMLLFVVNFTGFFLTYIMIRSSVWRRQWRVYQDNGRSALKEFANPNCPISSLLPRLASIPEEPPTMYIEEDDEPLQAWYRNRGDTPRCLAEGDVEIVRNNVIAAIFQVLAMNGPSGAYIGRCYHDIHRVRSSTEQHKRVLETQRRGSSTTFAYRIDGKSDRSRCVAFFTVSVDNKVEIFWSTSSLWLSGMDCFRYTSGWFLLSIIGAFCCLPFSVPCLVLYIYFSFPPSRGWTSLWAKATRDRNAGKLSGDSPSRDEQREMDRFRQDVHHVLKRYLEQTLERYR